MSDLEYGARIETEVAARVVGTLAPMLAVACLIIGAADLLSLLASTEQWTRLVPTGSLALLLLFDGWLVRQGRVRAAAHLFVGLICAAILLSMILNGGVQAPAYAATLPLVAVVAWLYGHRVAIPFTLFCVLTGGTFVWLDAGGWLRRLAPPGPLALWVNIAGFHIMALGATAIPSRMLRRAFADSEERRVEAETAHRREIQISSALAERERALRESEERYRTLVENVPGVNYRCACDPHWTMEFLSDEVETLTGYRAEEFLGNRVRSFVSVIHPDDVAMVQATVLEGVRNRQTFTVEYRIVRADGGVRWVYAKGQGVFHPDGRLRCLDGVILDITHRKQGEAERERLLSAIEQSGEVIIITDVNGTIEYVNPAFERTTGYTREEAIGQTPRILRSGQHDETFYSGMWRTLEAEENWHGRLVNRRADGTLYTEEATISPVKDPQGRTINYVAVKHDITELLRMHEERVKLQAQFQQAQKLESVGRLAGGVAHDLNNVLTPILGYSELLLKQCGEQPDSRECVEKIMQAGLHARDLVHRLLVFSRKQALELKPLDLNDVLSGFEKLLRRTIREDVVIAFLPAPSLPLIRGDSGQMQQVIMNLAVNAEDAMPDGGTLTLETLATEVPEGSAAAHEGIEPGAYVLLRVSDTGGGMDRETLERVFEPFFTTKGPDKGTGLGLATVYGIVKQHGGSIQVRSRPGKGTTFEVYLPALEAHTVPAEPVPPPQAETRGSETILLVEDNESVRDLSEAILKQHGYRVLIAENGRQALAMLEDHRGPLHLLLTDVVMPEMNGRELFDRVSRLYPDVRVLYMSGYADDVITARGLMDEDPNFVQKPFSVRTLSEKVREVLDGG